jgi:hypothetical protein
MMESLKTMLAIVGMITVARLMFKAGRAAEAYTASQNAHSSQGGSAA